MKKLRNALLLAALIAVTSVANASIIGYSIDSSNAPQLFTVDLETGSSAVVGPTGLTSTGTIQFQGLAFVGDTLFAGVDSVTGVGGPAAQSLYSIDLATGAATLIGGFGSSVAEFGMAYDGATLFLNDRSTQSLYSVNTSSGLLTTIGTSFAGDSIAFFDNTLYGVQYGAGNVLELVSIDRATGAATTLFSTGETAMSTGLTATADALYLLSVDVNEAGHLWKVDLPGDALVEEEMTLSAANLARNAGLPAPSPATGEIVPEPSSWCIFAGLAVTVGLGGWRRRRCRFPTVGTGVSDALC